MLDREAHCWASRALGGSWVSVSRDFGVLSRGSSSSGSFATRGHLPLTWEHLKFRCSRTRRLGFEMRHPEGGIQLYCIVRAIP